MTLFWATIRRHSVSLFVCLFLSHVHVFSNEISLVCRLKCRYSCFSSHFCFLVIFVPLMFVLSVLFLVDLIRLPPRFFYVVFLSLYRCIDAILNAGKSYSSFFSWHIQTVYVISRMFIIVRIFYTKFIRWIFSGVWVTVNLNWSPGLFSVFYLILTVL